MAKCKIPQIESSPVEFELDLLQKQSLEDDAYLDMVLQQTSKLDREQLKDIRFSLSQGNIYSFTGNAIYVDKTKQILSALDQRWIFLARPRRMGKTLTQSTIKLMSSEVYLQSIYPEHQLHPILKNTYFAQKYAEGGLASEAGLGAPFNISLSFNEIKVDPMLKDRLNRDQRQNLSLQKQQLEQEFLDNLDYKIVCEYIEKKASLESDFNFLENGNLIYQDLAKKINLNRVNLLKFLFVLDQDVNKSQGQLLDIIKAKLADVNRQQSNILSKVDNLDATLKSLDTRIVGEVIQPNAMVNSLCSLELQEKLGQFRGNILIKMTNSMLLAVQENISILDELKQEILAKSPNYQHGLDTIEQHAQIARQRQKQLTTFLQEIKAVVTWDAVSFTDTLTKLVCMFNSKDLSIFIDEYDASLTDCLDNAFVAEFVRQVMEEFYACLKSDELSKCISIFFVTGVTAFAKVSLFSGANNINDISYNPNFSDIVGFTEHEIKRNFAFILCKHALLNNCPVQDIIDNLARYYDGYYFALPTSNQIILPIFNPLSVVKALINTPIAYNNYWTSSGAGLSKTVLQNLTQIPREELTKTINQALNGLGVEVIIRNNSEDIFSKISFSEMQKSAVFLLYQAGYLTIDFESSFHKNYQSYQAENIKRIVILTPPNLEVRRFLLEELEILINDYRDWKFGEKIYPLFDVDAQTRLSISSLGRLTLILKAFVNFNLNDCEYSFNLMLGQYANDINNQALWENFLRNILFVCIRENINASCSNKVLHAETEVPVNAGRIDLIVTNERDKIKFVFEFKRVDESNPTNTQIQQALNKASNQIKSHNYTAHAGYRVITIVGAFFRNTKHFAQNAFSLGYHINLAEVLQVNHS